jgi:hypothetical protein
MKNTTEEKQFIAETFGVPIEDAIYYHSGICYSRAGVKTKESAEMIANAVEGRVVNGGWYDGMKLGIVSKFADSGEIWYEVTC